MSQYLTTAEAAVLLGLQERRVRQLITEGVIVPAGTHGGVYLLTRAAVLKARGRNRTPGPRPKKSGKAP